MVCYQRFAINLVVKQDDLRFFATSNSVSQATIVAELKQNIAKFMECALIGMINNPDAVKIHACPSRRLDFSLSRYLTRAPSVSPGA